MLSCNNDTFMTLDEIFSNDRSSTESVLKILTEFEYHMLERHCHH